MSTDTPDDLWKEAMALLLRWRQAPDDEAARQEVRAFCARGEAQLKAWTEAKTVYRLGRAALDAKPAEQPGARIPRRRLLGFAGAAVLGGGLAYRYANRLPPGALLTQTAEITDIDLADGSRLTLGPDTRVLVAFSDEARGIDLLDGLLYCRFADDPRPAVLRAGSLRVEAAAATLDVSFDVESCYAGVVAGHAAWSFGAAEGEALRDGDWIRAGFDDGRVERGRFAAERAGEWRLGRIVVQNERVDRVVARIARWQSGKVVIAGKALGMARISGVFDAADPLAALETVVTPHGGRVRRVSPWLTVLTTL